MTGRRAVIGLCMLCALAISAIAAQSAAALTGTTADTCTESTPFTTGTNKFSDAHCKVVDNVAGKFGHKEIPAATTTELSGDNNNEKGEPTTTRLKATVGGIPVTLESNSVSGEGSFENLTTGKEHYVEGTGTITYKNVVVAGTLGESCKVVTDSAAGTGEDGVVHTEPLVATTMEQGMFLKFEPINAEKVFARFELVAKPGKTCAVEKTYTVTGSVKGVPTGATTVFTHTETTEQNTLKLGGFKAGIEGSLTIKGRAKGGGAFTALAATTVETP